MHSNAVNSIVYDRENRQSFYNNTERTLTGSFYHQRQERQKINIYAHNHSQCNYRATHPVDRRKDSQAVGDSSTEWIVLHSPVTATWCIPIFCNDFPSIFCQWIRHTVKLPWTNLRSWNIKLQHSEKKSFKIYLHSKQKRQRKLSLCSSASNSSYSGFEHHRQFSLSKLGICNVIGE